LIPLQLYTHEIIQYTHQNPQIHHFYIKLWIRSGASLLQSTKSAKHYLLGQGHIHIQNLLQHYQTQNMKQQSPPSHYQTLYWKMHLQSQYLVDAQIFVTAIPDNKIPNIGGRGWSLADPDPITAYSNHSHYKLFNPPLDQSYGFTLNVNNYATLLATERSTESAIALPIAAAFAKLANHACQISLHHAKSVQ
jgi:hypothetical protein